MIDLQRIVASGRSIRGYERIVLTKMVCLFSRHHCSAVFGVQPDDIETALGESWINLQLQGMAVGLAEQSNLAPAAIISAVAVSFLNSIDSKEDDGWGAVEGIKRYAEVRRDYGTGKDYFAMFGDGSPGGAFNVYGALAIASPVYVGLGVATSIATTGPDMITNWLGLTESDEDVAKLGSNAAVLLGEVIPSIVG